jgi:hypothetical protein
MVPALGRQESFLVRRRNPPTRETSPESPSLDVKSERELALLVKVLVDVQIALLDGAIDVAILEGDGSRR